MKKELTKKMVKKLKMGECFNILTYEWRETSEAISEDVNLEQEDLKELNLDKEEMMLSNVSKEICAISLLDFGLSTIIHTSYQDIVELTREYQRCSDEGWLFNDAEEMCKTILDQLRRLDTLFKCKPKLVDRQNPDWVNYCRGCLCVYVLDAYLTKKQFRFLHPQSYEKLLNAGAIDATSGMVPTKFSVLTSPAIK